MKHTKGPWRVGDAGHAVFGAKYSGVHPDAPITIVQGLANKANARLIAAAPELLQLLESGLECGVFEDAPVFKADVITLINKINGKL